MSWKSRWGTVVLAGIVAASSSIGVAEAQDRDAIVAFCLANPDSCALSVLNLSKGWEAHLNPDRPQPLASAMKVLHLIAYARAVADGVLSPDDTLTREQWARYLTLDGNALAGAWESLGRPDKVTLDQLMKVMVEFSDNSTPDHMLAMLGGKRLRKARKKDVRGFMDEPNPLSGSFAGWLGAAGEPGSGNRFVADYGGIGADGYRDEIDAIFKDLQKDDDTVADVREALCVAPPWARVACNPPNPALTEASYRALEKSFFTRSTARTFAQLYASLLRRDRLPADVQEVVEPALEVWLDVFPTLSPAFRRYGLKGGSLATSTGLDVLTWAHYMETGDGTQVVVVLFLQRLLEAKSPPSAGDINSFVQQVALDPSFAEQVRAALEPDDERPELVPSILNLKLRNGRKIILKGRVDNASPNATGGIIQVRVYVSDDAEVDASDTLVKSLKLPKRAGYKGKSFKVKGAVAGAAGKLLLVVVDPGDDIAEQDEDNNLLWQALR